MRDLALAILGKNAQKQLERGLGLTPAQAHHIIYHDQCASHLRAALIDYLERACAFAEGRLGAAKNELKSIRTTEMLERASHRRLDGGRAESPTLPGLGARTEKPPVRRRP